MLKALLFGLILENLLFCHKLDKIQDRIKSRLAGGLVVDIDVPDLELKIKIIKKKIEEIQNQFKENINLSDEVIKLYC